MGLFDFLKKKAPQPAPLADGIELVSVTDGSHGDNFGALVGFETLQSPNGEKQINAYLSLAAAGPAVWEGRPARVHETTLGDAGTKAEHLKVRTLLVNGKVVSAFPYLRTDYVLPFKTKQIREWSHVGNLEAEITGGGRDTFGLGFFATDYAANQSKYKASQHLQVRISAIGLVLDKSDLTEINGQQLAEGFAAYMPSSQMSRPTYYDFIGVLIDIEPVRAAGDLAGYLTRIKLINEENDPDFFTVDMFINQENMKTPALEKGMRVAGLLWFQGELA